MRLLLPVVALCACVHHPLSRAALADTRVVAIVARIEDEAGPRSTVFRGDSAYRPQLSPRRIDDKEADRRLAAVLSNGTMEKDSSGVKRLKARTMTRFELADSLRSGVLVALPREAPWTSVADPAEVASLLESFLVQEVPANAPDYLRLGERGIDTVVEIVIESYGMRSEKGKAGVYLVGTARMFRVGGGEIYSRKFSSDELDSGREGVDPFAVAKNATLFSEHMKPLIAGVADQVAKDLSVGGVPVRGEDVQTPRRMPAAPPPADDDPL